jgi:hypothetical protein
MLPAVAVNLLLGGRILAPEEHLAELDAVTVEDVRAVAAEVWAGALVQVPGGRLDWAGAVAAPTWSEDAVSGESFVHLEDPDVTLVIGEDGVSLVTPGGPATVRFEECVAVITRPDGARYLTGADGFRVAVEPTLYAGLTPAIVAARIDARLPRELVVPLPPREADAIPHPAEKPRTSRAARLLAPVRRLLQPLGDAVYTKVGRWSWLLFAAGWYLGVRAASVLRRIQRGESDDTAIVVILGALALGLLGTWLYVVIRSRRER